MTRVCVHVTKATVNTAAQTRSNICAGDDELTQVTRATTVPTSLLLLLLVNNDDSDHDEDGARTGGCGGCADTAPRVTCQRVTSARYSMKLCA